MNRRPSEWLKWVKLYINDGVPISKIADKYHLDVSKLKYRIRLYQLHGEAPFTDDQEKRVYTREEN